MHDIAEGTRASRPARERADAAFQATFGAPPSLRARAPGRINIIGEHVDYNDGYVLPVAIDRDVAVAIRPRFDRQVLVFAADPAESDHFALDALRPDGARARPGPDSPRGWRAYVRGVAALIEERGLALPGADIALAGDVPPGAGLSSSAALELAVASGLLGLVRATLPREQLAALGRRAEIEWAGVHCGIMDQFIAALGRRDHGLFLDCRSLDYRYVPIPPALRLVAVDSGIRRALQDSAYNQRVEECREACARLGVASLRDVDAGTLSRRERLLPEPLRRRARHVVEEIARTHAAAEALSQGDIAAVGALVDESHDSLSRLYEVSTPELDELAGICQHVPGVYGSRIMGAGFGGCVLALVDAEGVGAFLDTVPAAYTRRTGRSPIAYVCRTGDGASLE